MRKLNKRWQLLIYGCSGIGVNLLNTIVGTYLCSALLTGGFVENVEHWTYTNKNLVVAGVWAVMIVVAKLVDGIIDLPMSSFTDNLRSKWGRRRPSILIGWVPMIIAYLLFLLPLSGEASLLNTIWFAVILCVFYAFYTLTMVTYYATFAEVVDNEGDRVFLSSVKSVCDVVYFCIGFALIPLFVNLGTNIRIVALCFLPLALSMFIPLFLLKEDPNNQADAPVEKVKPVNLWKSIAHCVRNKDFLIWMLVHAIVFNLGMTLFLSGINEFFSTAGLPMTPIMACSFGPVPFTILLYNKVVKKKGVGFAYRYILITFAAAMLLMTTSSWVPESYRIIIGIASALIASFSIGAFFSVGYTVPAHIAAESNEKTGIMMSSMIFAVQGLFEGVSAGIASGVILTFIKDHDGSVAEAGTWFETTRLAGFIPVVVAFFCLMACLLTLIVPKSILKLGKE
ncbi:MAG: MFS transporter [Clostridia bacterium]|nr:MFS transporter [Clostridia bacterium]